MEKKEIPQASKEMENYFFNIQDEVKKTYAVALDARKKGFDPEDDVNIKLAKNMAERVEGLISMVAPQLIGSGMTDRIFELEEKYSPLDWRVALIIGEEVAKEKFCKFKDKNEAVEVGIRVGFAYHTSGIVAAPLEGFVELNIKKRRDGKEYVSPMYSGPIRGAGGTASSFSLLLTDYVRMKLGYDKWDPTEEEIGRIKTEIVDYHERVTNLQYFPSAEELDFLLRHIPIEISGDPTEKFEVSNFKDIERIGSNRIRGGVCLVLAEGLSQKAPKLWKRLEEWGDEFGLDWGFLKDFLKLKKKILSKANAGSKKVKVEKKNLTNKEKVMPNYTFIKDLVAGRPILGFPKSVGSFRLRYGRSRITGFSAAAIHPATMFILDDYIATGTQLKIERPGKAASMVPCDTILGPVVKLKDGSVVYVDSISLAKEIRRKVEKILFLGDALFNYGDFSENGHMLVPCGYNEDWWECEVEKKAIKKFGSYDLEKISKKTSIKKENLKNYIENKNTSYIKIKDALLLSLKFGVPLHPSHLFFWDLISNDELKELIEWLKELNVKKEDGKFIKAILPNHNSKKAILEKIGLPHLLVNKEFIVIEKEIAYAFLYTIGFLGERNYKKLIEKIDHNKTILENLCALSGLIIKDKSGIFVGARMGRPEKAKMRKMTGGPHTLFPVGEEGGRFKSFFTAVDKGYINSDFVTLYCKKCNHKTIYRMCEKCGTKTEQRYYCRECNDYYEKNECPMHGQLKPFKRRKIKIESYFKSAHKKLNLTKNPKIIIKGVKATRNEDHMPEHLTKGILRAKHNLFVNKDGTIRFDMSELPITHFKPNEIGITLEKLDEIGYKKDCKGEKITDLSQIIELKPHDIILPAGSEAMDEQADQVMFRVTKFVDELLVGLYGLKPFYNFTKRSDLIGSYVIGIAPHISAGTVARIIGFSKTQGLFAHPLLHAAFRRDCDGDEAAIIMLMDAFLNFSSKYLPNTRGAKTMDAPLVLTSRIIPTEVDDMVHGLDTVWKYPLEFYEAGLNLKNPWDVKIDQVKQFLNTERQYEGYGFTHDTNSINESVNCSAYKLLPSMKEKLDGQMKLAVKINAVDESKVAQFVIEKHFLKDIKGNLRKFSMQRFRCVACNEKYRRPPLIGKCVKNNCGGKIIFTISHGSVIKYLQPSVNLANTYNVPSYLKQTLDILSKRVDEVFGKEKEKQEGLNKWFGQ